MEKKPFRHIKLSGPNESYNYTSVNAGGTPFKTPTRNRNQHGRRIYQQLEKAWQESENEYLVTYPERTGIYLEFVSSPGFELIIKSLENLPQGIRLCNVRTEERIINKEKTEVTLATVFIPNNKREFFFRKVEQYLSEETGKGKPKNADLINSIEELRTALLVESFWTDDNNLIPDEEPEWCEVWLRWNKVEYEVVNRFDNLLLEQEINSKSGYIKFPERIVKLVLVNREQLQNLSRFSDDIAEYRKAKNTAEFFLNLEPFEQQEWAEDILNRLSVNEDYQVTICLLDTGVNNGHPLINPVLDNNDLLSVNNAWGTNDYDGHGTLMAGVAAYGDLQELLASTENIILYHTLESVKILPPKGQNDPELWGDITSQAVSIAEINSPDKKRIICSAVTASDTRDRGRPTSWSGAIDNISSGAFDSNKRLIILAAGNITDFNQITNYPTNQVTDSIHDPAQAWNALTVGAYTELATLTDPNLDGYSPLARKNQLSPFSTSSSLWENKWPIKPEVVFEGGNVAVDNANMWTECNDLSLISTYYRPLQRLFEPFNMTSAATAQAAYFAARIQADYPEYWPETVRGLIVHSANWPNELFSQFVQNSNAKREIGNLLRIVGYGVPNIEKALYCARNNLTLIVQAEIQPFVKESGTQPKSNEMHLYRLPLPSEVLQELGGTEVKMRITLSYFIEPGPGEIGWKDRYRYPSHGLRFSINSPTESENEFIRRINTAVRDEENGKPDTESPSNHWVIGSKKRNKGSIHSDIWIGTAADLASSNLIAVFPSIGWWRERPHLKKVNKRTRYSLIVSIETQELNVDIYTPVAIQLGQQVPIEVHSTQ